MNHEMRFIITIDKQIMKNRFLVNARYVKA